MRLNKLAKKFFAAGLAVSLMMANAGVSFAEQSFKYDPISGGETEFNKELEFKAEATVPNATFTFDIAPGTEVKATEKTAAVYAGIKKGEYPKVNEVVFAPTDTESATAKPNDDTKKIVSKKVKVEFGNEQIFEAPGIYRYIITENNSTAKGVQNDSEAIRTLDVYVIDKNGKLEVNSYVFLKGQFTGAPSISDESGATGEYGDKSDKYTNTYETFNLDIKKMVSGNQASRDKYFAITVKIEGADKGTEYKVNLENAEAKPEKTASTKYTEMSNVAKLTADDNGSVTQTFYLQHNQTIKIEGLATGTKYTVTEDAEDYKSSAPEGFSSGQDGITADASATFTNTKNGTIPTGVILDSAPFILIIGLAAAALIITAARKKVR